jgi:hypothetical protein
MVRGKAASLMRNHLRLLSYVADCSAIHETLVGVVAVLVDLLSIVWFQLGIFHVLNLFLLATVVSIVNLACRFLSHFTTLVPVMHVLHV